MKRLIFAGLAALLLAISAPGFGGFGTGSLGGPDGFSKSAGGPCSAATAFLARNGNANATATTTLICGMVTDGTWAKLDVLYVFATDTSAHALLNWTSSSFTATNAGGLTFTANTGFTGDLTHSLDTTWVPSTNAVNFTLNSGGNGFCDLTSRTANQTFTAFGAQNNAGTAFTYMRSLNNSGNVEYGVNDGTFSTFSNVSGNAKGSYASNRTDSTHVAVYKNGSSTPIGSTAAATSVALPNVSIYIFAYNDANSVTAPSSDQEAYYFAGGGFSATDIANIQTRLSTYLTAVGAPSGC